MQKMETSLSTPLLLRRVEVHLEPRLGKQLGRVRYVKVRPGEGVIALP